MNPLRSDLTAGLVVLCATGFALAALITAPVVAETSDLFWAIAAGRWMVENQAVLRIDPFSYTFTGHPWHTEAWLGQLALAGAYLATGYASVLALCGAVAGISAAALGLFLAKFLRPGVLFAALLLSFVVAAGVIQAVPHLLALPFAVIYLGGLVVARAEARKPSLWLLLALLLWANLTSGYVLGLAITAGLGLEAGLATRRLDVARDWLLFTGYALMVSLVTPFGLDGLVHAIRGFGLPLGQMVPSLMPLLLGLPITALLLSRWQNGLRAGLVILLFAQALYHSEARLLFAVAAPLLGAPALRQGVLSCALGWRPTAALLGLAVLALLVRVLVPLELPDSAVVPKSALAALPPALLHRAVLNEASFGGYLATHDVKPFIDNRPIYSGAFRARFDRLGDNKTLAETLSHYHIRWTVLAPANPAVKVLDGMKGWRRLYSNPVAVVHIQNEAL